LKRLIQPPLKSDVKTELGLQQSVDALLRWSEQVSRVINNLVSNIPADSTAVDVAGVVSDLNDLQDVIRDLDVK
jgi:hypothetical protein